jgi:glycosyltransferase involved in cell wall biosynthesis
VTLRGTEASLLELYERVAEVRQVAPTPTIAQGAVLAAICHQERADVLHAHMGTATAAAVIAATVSSRPIVTTLHFVRLRHTQRRFAGIRSRLFRQMTRRTDAVIVISTAVREMAISNRLHEADRIHLVFNGVGCTDLRQAGISETPKDPTILYAGRLSEDKQVGVLIEAIASSASPFELWLAGRGDQESKLRAIAAARLPGRHRFLGFQPDIRGVIRDARLLVLPSREEPFGLVALEAMREGRPVVGLAAGGLVDIVVDGQTGFLVKPNDPDQLRESIERLLADRSQATEMGRNGRERYLRYFTADGMASATAALYEAMLREGAAPAVET